MKPVGLHDPRTGKGTAYAVVQLRQETLRADSITLISTRTTSNTASSSASAPVPGLEKAEFLRYGQVHRNTYINAPALLAPTLQLKSHPHPVCRADLQHPRVTWNSMSTGLMAGWNAARLARGEEPLTWPRASARRVAVALHLQRDRIPLPANITFDLLPSLRAGGGAQVQARPQEPPERGSAS
ncbi:MAG: FAD-dependent oxidoreductase [Bryobacterales bacterium]